MTLPVMVLLAWAAPAFAGSVRVSPAIDGSVTVEWDPNSETDIAGYKLSYGTQSGVYTTTIDVGNVTSWPLTLGPGTYYFAVRAYNTAGAVSAFSTEVDDTITSGSGPAISSVTPASGAVGEAVTITGGDFGSTQGTSTVTFNGVTATQTDWSATSITVAIPSGATTGDVVVTVGGIASNGVTFTVVTPSITSLSPTTGAVTLSVTVTGTNFGSIQGASTVAFNGVMATPTAWSNTSITVPVPSGATTGNVTVTRGSVASNGKPFTVVPTATILEVSPTSGAVGATVAITGTNFGFPQGTSTVSFNGVTATATTWTPINVISVIVPSGATTGNVTVTRGGVASNGVAFTVVPKITSLSPTSGPVGATVTITGTTFGATQGASTVSFNGVTATPTSWSATSITVPVPSAAMTGNVVVTVGVSASTGVAFTVVPAISSLSPTSGAVTAAVTITGTTFGSSQGTSTVSFNGVTATPSAWSDTSITVPVPGGATTGNVTVTRGGVASNGVTFTVVPTASITSLSRTSGAVSATVVITGTNFGSTQDTSTVTFNGVTATPTAWSDASITVAVPGGATTGNVTVTRGGVASNGVTFTVVPTASIASLSPTTGAVAASVTITGTNFGSTQGTSTISFNGVTATPTAWSATSIVTTVPSGATTGPVTVTVGGVASNGMTFTVVPTASITSLSPSTGAVTASVTITGTNFGATQGTNTISFNGATATPSSWSATSIVTIVPSGATTGPVTITVGGVASNGVTFAVVPTATITSLSPTSGAVGATVTIIGANLGATQGTSTVRFNGVTATPISWSATSIVTTVPSGATTGSVVVTLGGVASNGVTFTVEPPAPTGQPTMAVDRTSLNFGAVNAGTSFTSQTPAQTVNITQTGTQNTVTWTAASDAPWLTVSPTSGSGQAALSIGVQHASTLPPAGSASVTGAITVTYTGSATATSTVSARLNLPAAPAAPTGLIDTPAAGATGLQGSIPVTGWAVDDVAVDRVELWRDPVPGEPAFVTTPSDPRHGKVFIGTATMVDGARPDIEGLNPTMPLSYRGGWGYLMLTWGLPNQGNGTYTLHAIAIDVDGHIATLGQTTIGIANASANQPFGSIDTPAIGGTASGSMVNFGWALTPGTSCKVPATGVQVSIDSGPLQPVVYGDVRNDVAGLFAGFTNSAAAGGHVTLDTTALANGVHTIAWLITDDCNRAAGVGSRYFTVQNPSVVTVPAGAARARVAAVAGPAASVAARVESADPVVVARGFGELGVTVYPDSTGLRVVSLKPGERIEMRLPNGYDEAWQVVAGERRALPIGANWDPASHIFAWEPAPGFLGDFDMVFVRGTETIRVLFSMK